MTSLSNLYGRQPVMVLACVQAGLVMLMGFGLKMTGQNIAEIMTFVTLLFGILAQTQVTPMATLPDHVAAAVVIASNAGVQKIPIELPTAPLPSPADLTRPL